MPALSFFNDSAEVLAPKLYSIGSLNVEVSYFTLRTKQHVTSMISRFIEHCKGLSRIRIRFRAPPQ